MFALWSKTESVSSVGLGRLWYRDRNGQISAMRVARWTAADVMVRGAGGGGGGANVAFHGGKLILSAAVSLHTRKRGIVALYRACLLMRTAGPQRWLEESTSWLQAISFRLRSPAVDIVCSVYSYWYVCSVLYALCQLAFFGYPKWGFTMLFPQL
jgi:hypothetical protein